MDGEDLVAARHLKPGDVIQRHGEWRRVTQIWLDPRSPYNKIHTVLETESDKAISLYEKVSLDFIHRRKSVSNTKQVHFSAAIEEMSLLQMAIHDYAESNDLPEKVKLESTNFEIEATVIQRQCHEKMMASFNRLKNAINAVQKP